jgi:hypothetical protein
MLRTSLASQAFAPLQLGMAAGLSRVAAVTRQLEAFP